MKKHSQEMMCIVEHLMIQTSPVLVGVKPSVLTGICDTERCHGINFLDLWEKEKENIINDLGLSCRELKTTLRGKQLLFFDPDELKRTLMIRDNAEFLKRFGYFSCVSEKDYLDELKVRFNGRNFPHEIGVFLGYPLKDIKGFIYRESKPLAALSRWRIFGDPTGSLKLMELHKQVESVFKQLMDKGKDPMRFLDKLTMYFQDKNEFSSISV
ncbi:MAG: DUF3793 family protein [Candidatus Omnitrophica bacterium]|nr:DUF3793 family protein [Candidatus Omnitrophota bacterium]